MGEQVGGKREGGEGVRGEGVRGEGGGRRNDKQHARTHLAEARHLLVFRGGRPRNLQAEQIPKLGTLVADVFLDI